MSSYGWRERENRLSFDKSTERVYNKGTKRANFGEKKECKGHWQGPDRRGSTGQAKTTPSFYYLFIGELIYNY